MDLRDESFPVTIKNYLPNLPPQERLSFLKYHYDEGNVDMKNYVELTAYILHMDKEAHDQLVLDQSTGTKVKHSVIDRAVANQPWGGLTVTIRPDVTQMVPLNPKVTLTEVEPFTEVAKKERRQRKSPPSVKKVVESQRRARSPLLPTPRIPPVTPRPKPAMDSFNYGRLSHKFLDNSTGYNGKEEEWPFFYPGDQCYHCGRPGFLKMYCPYLNTLDEANHNWSWFMKKNRRTMTATYFDSRTTGNSRRGN